MARTIPIERTAELGYERFNITEEEYNYVKREAYKYSQPEDVRHLRHFTGITSLADLQSLLARAKVKDSIRVDYFKMAVIVKKANHNSRESGT